MQVKFRRFSSHARIPQKATIGSGCYNLFAAKPVVLEPNLTRSVEIDIGFCFSKKYIGKIYPRSSLSLHSIFDGGGMIDSDFRGNIHVILCISSGSRVEFNVGDRIAQVLFQIKEVVDFVEVSSFDDFPTKRRDKSFGSTGI